MELLMILKSFLFLNFWEIFTFCTWEAFIVRKSNFLVRWFWLSFLAFLGIWDEILLVLTTEQTHGESSVQSPDWYFFWCNQGGGSFPALFLPPGSSVSGRSLVDLKGKHASVEVWLPGFSRAGKVQLATGARASVSDPSLWDWWDLRFLERRPKVHERVQWRSFVRTWMRNRDPAKQSGNLRRAQVPKGCVTRLSD